MSLNSLPLFSTTSRNVSNIQPVGPAGAIESQSPGGGETSGAGVIGQQDDSVSISNEARGRFSEEQGGQKPPESAVKAEVGSERPSEEPDNDQELSESEKELVDRLKARDAEVRTHEQAHLAAAGGHARGGPKFDFQRGPDGQQYAVGGSVEIDVSPVPNDPEATIQKADTIRAAALAPASPSGKDRQVAAKAANLKAEAQQELQQERAAELQGKDQETNAVEPGGTEKAPNNAEDTKEFGASSLQGNAASQQAGRKVASVLGNVAANYNVLGGAPGNSSSGSLIDSVA